MKNKFWLIIILSAAFFSCKEEPEDLPLENSEIVGGGIGNAKLLQNADSQTVIGANSWVEVRQTAGGKKSVKKYETALRDSLKHQNAETIVQDFTLGNASVTYTYRQSKTRTEQKYLTVTDSVITINTAYENGFSFNIDLVYQTAFYDDGFSQKELDFIKIPLENIEFDDFSLTDLGAVEENGTVFERKRYEQTVILRNINGISCKFNVSCILKKIFNVSTGEILYSELVNSGINITGNNEASTLYQSWITVIQHKRNGQNEQKTITVPNLEGSITGLPISDFTTNNLDFINNIGTLENVSENFVATVGDFVTVKQVTRKYTTDAAYNMTANIVHSTAVYFDGATTITLPTLKHEDISDSFAEEFYRESSDAGGRYAQYRIFYTVSGKFGSRLHSVTRNFLVKIYK